MSNRPSKALFADRRYLVAIYLVSTLAACIRLWRAGSSGFWFDEVYSVELANLPWAEWGSSLLRDTTPPLHYVLIRLFMPLPIPPEWSARLPSILAGTATIPVVMSMTRRLGGQWTTCVAAGLILALSPFHLAYSQEARAYALMGFAVATSFCVMFAVLEHPTFRRLILYGFSLILMAISHNWAVFAVLGQFVSVMVSNRLPSSTKNKFLWIYASFGALYIFSAGFLWQQAHAPQLNVLHPTEWGDVLRLFKAYTNTEFRIGEAHWQFPAALTVLLVTWTLTMMAASLRESRISNGPLQLAWTSLAVTLAVPMLVGRFFPLFLADRYPVVIYPLFCVLLAFGAASFSSTFYAISVGVYLLVSGVQLPSFYRDFLKSSDREMAKELSAVIKAGDALWVIPAFDRRTLDYYAHLPVGSDLQPQRGKDVFILFNYRYHGESAAHIAHQFESQGYRLEASIQLGGKLLCRYGLVQ